MKGDGEAGRPKRRKSRTLSEEERRLWRSVIRDAKPLVPQPEFISEPEEMAQLGMDQAPETIPTSKQLSGAALPRSEIRSPSVMKPPASREPPSLTGLDRRTSQRLARGQIETEARLDLHGRRQEDARMALRAFLTRARAEGLRCVLVITGKGESPFARHTLHGGHYYQAPERQGVLRSALPVWLGEPEFRALVAGFQPAHPRHGGGGAFYVWLRRRR